MDVKRLRAEPGGQAQLSVKVKNPGHLVESFRMDVVGLDPTWWQVHPPELAVYPGKEESAVVVLSPPANAHAPEDALPFGVRAVSTLDAQRTVVEEGDLEVGRVLDLQATITPVTSKGRWSGRHTITYQNWGNSPAHLRLEVTEQDQELGFLLEPEQVSVPVGGVASARLRVRPRNPFLRGQAVRRPFQVVGESAGSGPVPGVPRSAAARAGVPDPGKPVLDAAILHLPILSREVLVLGGLLVAALAGLVVLWFRPITVLGAQQEDIAPEPPTQLVADAVSAELINLRWTGSDRAELYRVQRIDETTGAVQGTEDVKDATAFAAKVDKPLTAACFQVVAVRAGFASPPSERRCATTRDGRLPPPTNVAVRQVAEGYSVSWTDDAANDHTVLANDEVVGQVSPAPGKNVTVQLPAGRRCITVVARRQPSLSSPPSTPPVCVDVVAPETTAPPVPGTTTGGGAGGAAPGGAPTGAGSGGGGTGGAATGGAPGGGAATGGTPVVALGPFAALIGPPYPEPTLAAQVVKQVQQSSPTAQVVPVQQFPQLGYVQGVLIVVPNFATLAEAQAFCALPKPNFPPGCRAVAAP